MVDRADLLHLIGDQGVLLVGKQDAERLAGLERHGCAAFIDHRRPASRHGALRHLPPGKTLPRGRHDPEIGSDSLADAGHLGQQMLRRGNDFGEESESADQLLRNRLHVAPRDQAEQHRFEQFVIGQRIRPGCQETLAQPVAVPEIMRFRSGIRCHRGRSARDQPCLQSG